MASTILAPPATRKARERLGAELFFVIFCKNVGSLEMLGMIPQDNVFTIRDESLFHLTWDTVAFLFCARHKGIDTALHRAVDGIFRRLAARRFLPVPSGGSLSRGDADASRRIQSAHPRCKEFHSAGRFSDRTGAYAALFEDADRRRADQGSRHQAVGSSPRGRAHAYPGSHRLRSEIAAAAADQSERKRDAAASALDARSLHGAD